MNRLKPERQKQIISALVEGSSIRSTCSMTGVAMAAGVTNRLWEIEDIVALLNTAC